MSVLTSLIDERARWGRKQTSAVIRRNKMRAFINYAFLVLLFVAAYVFRAQLQVALGRIIS